MLLLCTRTLARRVIQSPLFAWVLLGCRHRVPIWHSENPAVTALRLRLITRCLRQRGPLQHRLWVFEHASVITPSAQGVRRRCTYIHSKLTSFPPCSCCRWVWWRPSSPPPALLAAFSPCPGLRGIAGVPLPLPSRVRPVGGPAHVALDVVADALLTPRISHCALICPG